MGIRDPQLTYHPRGLRLGSNISLESKVSGSSLVVEQAQVFPHDWHDHGSYLVGNGLKPINNGKSHSVVKWRFGFLGICRVLCMGLQVFVRSTMYFYYCTLISNFFKPAILESRGEPNGLDITETHQNIIFKFI